MGGFSISTEELGRRYGRDGTAEFTPVDYDAIARKHGGTVAEPSQAVDYDAIARKHGGTPQATEEEKRTVAGFLGNAVKSYGQLFNLPAQVEGMTALFSSMAEKSGLKPLPGIQGNAVDALVDHYKQRYGSLEGFQKALYEDPAGVMLDVATVLEPGAIGLKAAGLPRAAAVTTRAARGINPVAQTIRAGVAAAPYIATGARAAPTAIAGGARGAYKAAISPKTAGEAALGWTLTQVGVPHVGTALTGARIARGAYRGAREALKARAARAAESLRAREAPATIIREAPAEAPPIIGPERQLTAPPDVIVTPAPEAPPDTSFVRGVPAQYAEVIPRYMRSNAEAEAAALALKQAMQESGTIERGAGPITVPAPEIPTAASVRASDRIAQTLHEHGISAQDALLLDPSDWTGLTGPDAPPSLTRDAIVRLRELERAANRMPAETAKQAPAAAEATFQERKAKRTKAEAPPEAPALEAAEAAQNFREAVAVGAEDYRPPEGTAPRVRTAAEERIETIGKTIAAYKIPIEDVRRLAEEPLLLEQLARSLGVARPAPGEIPRIIRRIEELRGEPAAAPPAPPQSGLPAEVGRMAPADAEAVFQRTKRAKIEADAPTTERRNTLQGTSAEVPEPRSPVTGARSTAETTIRIPGEPQGYRANYAVRELSEIQPSHNPVTFEKNPQYHHRNDRNYSDPGNQERIVLNSQPGRFDPAYLLTDSPDAVNGAPVTDMRGNVLGGNSRRMILERVYRSNPEGAAAYRAELARRASQFGIDPASIEHMQQPILVRELVPDQDIAPQRAITELNKVGTAELTAAERATADARMLSADAADYLAGAMEAEGAEATLSDVLSGRRGAEIIQKLVDDGVFSMQEKPKLIDSRTGSVTAAAKERISKMLLGQVFESSDQMLRTPPEIRNKLERVVSPLVQSGSRRGFDLLPIVREAIDLLEYAQAHGIRNLEDAIAQEGLFGTAPQFSPQAVEMAEFIRGRKPTEISKAFRRYVASSEPTMFGESTPAEAFADAFRRE